MNCDDVQVAMTPYLDGELDPDRSRVVRGHLRSCGSCRAIAGDESTLRDGLRALAPLDPPAHLWRGIAAKLAEAEIADASGSRWRRWVARGTRPLRGLGSATRASVFAVGIAAIGILALWRRSDRGHETPSSTSPAVLVSAPAPEGAPCSSAGPRDLAFDLKVEPTCVTEAYAAAATGLIEEALQQRVRWTDERKKLFDAKLQQLRHDVDLASESLPRQRAYRTLIRYLQRATSRDDVAFADAQASHDR